MNSGLEALQEKQRAVLISCPGWDQPACAQQRKTLRGSQSELLSREVLVLVLSKGTVRDLEGVEIPDMVSSEIARKRGIDPSKFEVVLVGKDGGTKGRWGKPIDAREIYGHIDTMPLRQREMRGQNPGS